MRNVNGVIKKYLYDGYNILAEYDGTGNMTARYTQNLAIDDPLSMVRGGSAYYYHKDALGSITAMTDVNGQVAQTYEYDSFGNIANQTGNIENPFTYTGREYDAETGLYFYRARYYDARAGRFINEDPIGFGGGINIYGYVENSPINLIDPFGEYWGEKPINEVVPDPLVWPFEANGFEDVMKKLFQQQAEQYNANSQEYQLWHNLSENYGYLQAFIDDFLHQYDYDEALAHYKQVINSECHNKGAQK